MGKATRIEWTDHTWNPWWGCNEVSPGCDHCYARTMAKRTGHDVWGAPRTSARRFFDDKHWAEPLRWNEQAQAEGRPHLVFCASMADVFEWDPTLDAWRAKLWALIEATPWLIWQLLSKRPQLIMRLIPERWRAGLPANVWVGISAEDQDRLNLRVPYLIRVPAVVRFLSCEPLLGPLDATAWLWEDCPTYCTAPSHERAGHRVRSGAIQWVICGGESGPHARPMHPDWARGLRDQCHEAGVPFLFKQWGEWVPVDHYQRKWAGPVTSRQVQFSVHYVPRSGHGDPVHEVDLSVDLPAGAAPMIRLGKKDAGRLLDGRTWDEFPTIAPVQEAAYA